MYADTPSAERRMENRGPDTPGITPLSRARACGPVLVLLAVELVALLWMSRAMPLEITRFSAAVAVLLTVSGLLMPVLRPGVESRLAALLAVLLAGLLIIPFRLDSVRLDAPGPLLGHLPAHALFRYFNAVLAVPLGLHLAARFPPRSPAAGAHAPTDRQLFLAYVVTAVWAGGLMFVPDIWLRQAIGVPLFGWLVVLLILAHIQLVRVSRDPDPAWLGSARQARLLLLGFLLAETPLLLRLLLFGLGWPDAIPYEVALLFQVAVPLTVAYGIQRHDLFGIDAAVRRALAYTGVIAVLLGVYFGLTDLLSRLLVSLLPQFQTAALLLALLGAALAFRPLYSLLQRLVDRLFYPERARFAEEMGRMRARLQQVASRRQVTGLLVEELPAALDCLWATLVLAPAQDLPGHTDTLPAWNGRMEVGGRVLGRFWLGPRRSGLAFDGAERDQLHGVISQAALALAYAESVEELAALNRNLAEEVATQTARVLEQQRALAVTEERQRLARDLHDSVTQTLFSISLGSRALTKLVTRNPQAAAAGLAEQESAAQQALAEMRTLLAQLRSPATSQSDLAQALARHCASLAAVGLEVTYTGPEKLEVAAETGTELLYICREALHNVLKHAGVAQAECRLDVADDHLVMTVTDRGAGFALSGVESGVESGAGAGASRRTGHGLGLPSMRERADRMGATLTIDSAPGAGTTVTVRLPLGASHVADVGKSAVSVAES